MPFEKLFDVIINHYKKDISELKTKRRGKANIPRMMLIHLTQNSLQKTMSTIAHELGNIKAASVSRSCRVFSQRLKVYRALTAKVEMLSKLLLKE